MPFVGLAKAWLFGIFGYTLTHCFKSLMHKFNERDNKSECEIGFNIPTLPYFSTNAMEIPPVLSNVANINFYLNHIVFKLPKTDSENRIKKVPGGQTSSFCSVLCLLINPSI